MRMKHLAATVLICVSATPAYADSPFTLSLTVDGAPSVNQGFNKIENLLEQFSDAELANVSPGYTSNSAARGEINLRGLSGVVLSYEANSQVLRLQITSLGIDEQFNGGTRDESEELLEEWFKGGGKRQVTRLLNELAAKSPIDPVAGNPNSLMAGMAAADFASAANLPQALGKAGDGEDRNFFGISARFGQYTQRNFDSKVLSVPMSYTHLMTDPRYALVIDLPLTYVETEGAKTYAGSLGVGLRVPLAPRWNLTPAVRAGATGSADLGSAGIIYSGSLTSHYAFEPVSKFDISLVNMLAYYTTESIKAGDYDVGYDLQNTVMRNGLLTAREAGFSLLGAAMQWELQLVRTDYFGDELYSKNYQDVSVSLGTRKESGRLVWNALRIGLTYTFGQGDVDGAGMNLGYTF